MPVSDGRPTAANRWRKHWRESVLLNADTLLKMGVIDAATRRAVQISIDLQI